MSAKPYSKKDLNPCMIVFIAATINIKKVKYVQTGTTL
jgi:hypothetical protein